MAHSGRHIIDVVRVLVRRDFAGRYRNTALGMLWALVSPMMYLGVFYFVFNVLLRIGIPNYASFVLIGVLSWTWSQAAIGQAAAAITSNPNLVSQPGFPTTTLPVVAVTATLLNFVIALPLLAIVLAIDGIAPHWTYAYLPGVVAIQYLLTLAVCYFVAAANVYARDVQYIIPIFLQIGYFITPIFYDVDKIPAEYKGVLAANPMCAIVVSYRDILMHHQPPALMPLLIVLATALALLVLAYVYFRWASLRFLEEI